LKIDYRIIVRERFKKGMEDATFEFLGRFFRQNHMATLQIESFDYFLKHRINRTIDEDPEICVNINKDEAYRVSFGQVHVDKPYILDENRTIRHIYPNEARLRDLTYSSVVSVDVEAEMFRRDETTGEMVGCGVRQHPRMPICRLPIMVGSSACNLSDLTENDRLSKGECKFDRGGYFIIRGKERVIVAQERINYNMVFVFEPKPSTKNVISAEVRSMSDETGHSVFVQMKILSTKQVVMNLPYITIDVPLGYVLRAYGCSRQDVDRLVHPLNGAIIENLMDDFMVHDDPDKAIRAICQMASSFTQKDKKIQYVSQILDNEIFPHLGIMSHKNQKIMFIGHMLNRLVRVHNGEIPFDDRDHINNKRFEMTGVLVGDLFKTLYKRMLRTVETHLMKRPDISVVMSRVNSITLGFKHCFSTGNWGIPKSSYIRSGVSQVLSRLTFNSTLSHLRRCLIPIGKEGKNTKIRQVHASQIGFICAHETPEGHSAGIVKNFSVACRATTGFNVVILRKIVDGLPGVDGLGESVIAVRVGDYKLLINGWWGHIVRAENAESVKKTLYRMRECHLIDWSVSISVIPKLGEIHLFADEGRLIRPLWTSPPSADELLDPSKDIGYFEDMNRMRWFDSHEIDTMVIGVDSFDPSMHDAMEIHPSIIMGVCVGIIPYPDHTQSPRLCYQASMGKQAIGVYATTNSIRSDTIVHVLCSPERPIVRTHLSDWIGYNDIPSGNNLILAIACYTGFNQEDSVIFNRGSIERGVFRSFAFRSIMVEEKKKNSNSTDVIRLPPEHCRHRALNYTKLGDDGIVRLGVFVGPGDVIVGRTSERHQRIGQSDIIDQSVSIKNGEEGYIDSVLSHVSPDGYRIVRVRLRHLKIIETGDKVATRNGQKGTVGIVLPTEDMPFTLSGITPDIIMNPHAIPSRMTINQLLECVGAKSSVIRGSLRHCTAFSSHSTGVVDKLCEELHACGFERYGNERMFNGMTGELMDASIFIGPTYYQRLKHLVDSKIHARNFGNVQTLFRQPCEGRSKDGGLRFGEMERDAVRYDTVISLTCGLSVPIQDMRACGWSVLSWDASSELMVSSRQVDFLDKGLRDCYEMVLEDGRKVYPSVRHPFLTSDNRWIRAHEIVPNETVLRVSLEHPVLHLERELEQCADWSLLGEYRADTPSELLRSMAFVRLIGFLSTDGHICRNGSFCQVYLGHHMDVVACCDDINTICRRMTISPEVVDLCERSNVYIISLPHQIKNDILRLEGMTRGNKTDQPMVFPSFIMDPSCPLPILREFLGGMFGGDGHTCYLAMHRGKRDQLTSVCFSKSTRLPLLSSLTAFFENFVILLKRFDITRVSLQNPKETTSSKKIVGGSDDQRTFSITLHIEIEQLILFAEKIGFRYCHHKSQRLQASVCYFRLRDQVKRQHNWLVQRVDALTNFSKIKTENPNKKVSTKKAIEQAVKELEDTEPLFHEYAIPSTHDMTDHLVKGTSFGKFTSKGFPTADKFLDKIGALSLFTCDNDQIQYGVKRGEDGLCTISLRVLSMKPIGEHRVFDIQVDKTESFLADGVVAHNCMISHGVSRFLLERLFDMSDPFQMNVCSACGMPPKDGTTCDCDHAHESSVVSINIPYACKLLFQELGAMGIRIQTFPDKLKIENADPNIITAAV